MHADETLATSDVRHDVAIIGAGPIGLELAAALSTSGLDVIVFDAGCIGSTIAWWAPETTFFSSPERIAIAGVPLVSVDQSKATRERYLAYLRGVATQFGIPLRLFTRVERITRDDDGFTLFTAPSSHGVGGPGELHRTTLAPGSLRTHRARRVVLAIGDMHRPRLIDVAGEDLPHVSHFFEDPHHCYRQRVLVVGGRNSAVEAAIRLHRVGADVAISYRGDAFDPKRVKYWLRPEIEWLIEHRRVGFHPRTRVESIDSGSVRLVAVDGTKSTIVPADRVFLLTGYVQSTELFDQLGVEFVGEDRSPRHDRATMETNVPGLFVAGTAAAGTQRRTRVFIETSHDHVERIVRVITGGDVPWSASADRTGYEKLEES